jgi:hypothetical protein
VLDQYERVCFDKGLLAQAGGAQIDFVCPGHPLLDTVIDLTLSRYRETLRAGTVLVDPTDPGTEPRMLFCLAQNIQDARPAANGDKRTISREVHFVEINQAGQTRAGGYAPYLDYRPATTDELAQLTSTLADDWLTGETLENQVVAYAITQLVPRHLAGVRAGREALIDKTLAAVQERLTKEINFWDRRATELRQTEKDGKVNVRLNAGLAQQRADDLAARLDRRKADLALERQISATPPVVIGGALVIPIGLLLGDKTPPELLDTRITEAIAMQAVLAAETRLGCHPRDVSAENRGYDIESLDPRTGRLRFIEVKGRRAGADTVTVTHNEIMCGINSPEQFILAVVEVEDGQGRAPRYVRTPFPREPHSIESSIDYKLGDLLARSEPPG